MKEAINNDFWATLTKAEIAYDDAQEQLHEMESDWPEAKHTHLATPLSVRSYQSRAKKTKFSIDAMCIKRSKHNWPHKRPLQGDRQCTDLQ